MLSVLNIQKSNDWKNFRLKSLQRLNLTDKCRFYSLNMKLSDVLDDISRSLYIRDGLRFCYKLEFLLIIKLNNVYIYLYTFSLIYYAQQ